MSLTNPIIAKLLASVAPDVHTKLSSSFAFKVSLIYLRASSIESLIRYPER